MRWLLVVLLVLMGVPGWTGADRLELLHDDVRVHARGWRPANGWPARIGALRPLGAVAIAASDPAFGGFSSMSLRGGRALLLSDGGNYVALRIAGGHVQTLSAGPLPDGPGRGWKKEDRDSESMVEDARTGALWVGFENHNAIWRYHPGFAAAAAHAEPAPMRKWRVNGGPESLTRLPDGRFLVLQEVARRGRARTALLFDRDPTDRHARVAHFRYEPPTGFSPSDAAALPNGDVLVLNRRWRFPLRFENRLVRLPAQALHAGAVVRGQPVATLSPWVSENCEALAVTQEGGAIMLWIATDNDNYWWRPSLLMKFQLLDGANANGPPPGNGKRAVKP